MVKYDDSFGGKKKFLVEGKALPKLFLKRM
jgi:hypothetical protein